MGGSGWVGWIGWVSAWVGEGAGRWTSERVGVPSQESIERKIR